MIPIADIAEDSVAAVRKWRKILDKNNGKLVCPVRKKGSRRISQLNDEQKQQLKEIVLKGPMSEFPLMKQKAVRENMTLDNHGTIC
jgi:hypothetical protein